MFYGCETLIEVNLNPSLNTDSNLENKPLKKYFEEWLNKENFIPIEYKELLFALNNYRKSVLKSQIG